MTRRPINLGTVFALMVLALAYAGCNASPTARWASARNALTAAQDGILELHEGGVISDEELVKIDVAVQTARRGLKVAESQLPDGGNEFEHWLEIASAGLDQLAIIERQRLEK